MDFEEGLEIKRSCKCLLSAYYVLDALYVSHHLVIPEVERILLTLIHIQKIKILRLRKIQ